MNVMIVDKESAILSRRYAMVQALGEQPTRCLSQLPQFSLHFALQATRSERHSRASLASTEGLHERVSS